MAEIIIPIAETHYLPLTTQAFIDGNEILSSLVPVKHEIIESKRLIEKRSGFDSAKREALYKVLSNQYAFLNDAEKKIGKTWENIEFLKNENTFTVTTGQQLHIFMGPLFFAYKIISAVKLAEEIQKENPGKIIVPVFWMASEDHDIDEIGFIKLFNEIFTWKPEGKGATGKLNCNGLPELADEIEARLSKEVHAKEIIEIFRNIYKNSATLSEATRKIIYHFFGYTGIVVLDADEPLLKEFFKTYIKSDILDNVNYPVVEASGKKLKKKGFDIQINARAVNFFYLSENFRERIVFESGQYKVLNSDLTFTKSEVSDLIDSDPSKFSPNVVLRPLYQEVILPNIAYVAGGSELNYWLQLPEMFKINMVPYPIPFLRNSLHYMGSKQLGILNKNNLEPKILFLAEDDLKQRLTDKFSGENNFSFALAERIKNNEALFEAMNSLKPSSLKELKQILTNELASLKKLETETGIVLFEKSEILVNKILEMKRNYFNPEAIQERKTFCLEYLVT
ncbi:MAG: bacillithiol biosynthesis cysteine-adding enzyme BshC, partial [Bacteroidia bacterium]|nr:bacillithiol biosynthesis cysteine-adding enzyme BshC [Bacteroidia bacterium]